MPPQTRGFPADEAVERGFRQEKSHSRLLCAASSALLRASHRGRQIDVYDCSDASMLLEMNSSFLLPFFFFFKERLQRKNMASRISKFGTLPV